MINHKNIETKSEFMFFFFFWVDGLNVWLENAKFSEKPSRDGQTLI